MRTSRVLLAGVAVAAAAAGTSAFTTSNDFTGLDNNVAGYGELAVSGANVSNIAYNPDTDVSKLNNVVFTSDDRIDGGAATMGLTLAGVATTGGANTCAIGAWDAGTTSQPITCTLTAPVAFAAFDKVALTVVSQ
jgi:hypothetical protein